MRVIFMQKIVRNDVKLPAQGKQPRKSVVGKEENEEKIFRGHGPVKGTGGQHYG